MKRIKEAIYNSIVTKLKIAKDNEILTKIDVAGRSLVATLQKGNKILIAGNGGSAADAQHFAAELAGKFVHERKGLAGIALTTNSSIITAIGNDFGYDQTISRQIEALGARGDVFVGISTSGNSKNILLAIEKARELGLYTIGLIGNQGGLMANNCHLSIIIPSNSTQSIQESHIMIIHILCSIIDEAFAS